VGVEEAREMGEVTVGHGSHEAEYGGPSAFASGRGRFNVLVLPATRHELVPVTHPWGRDLRKFSRMDSEIAAWGTLDVGT
jgi:hypothetical protein